MLIVSNWKAYVESAKEAKALVAAATTLSKGEHELVLAPPAPLLALCTGGSKPKGKVAYAAQNISEAVRGAATGEDTAVLLKNIGVTHAIIGHSERRAMGESDAQVAAKVSLALAQGITPIVCVGERERDAESHYLQFLRSQVSSVFELLSAKDRARVVLAYEPIWAIGKSAAESITPSELHEMMLYIRKILSHYLEGTAVQKVRVLYGGSVEAGNIAALAEGSQVDGFLIGHASAEVASYRALIKALS